MPSIHSYVVRYDSGFAPNPFYGFCTLATCKPRIRKGANIGDWIVGSGSNDKSIRRGGYLVYAMRVTEAISLSKYDQDARFQNKKPFRYGSRKQSCGDNIYYHQHDHAGWHQRDSFHSLSNGQPHPDHISRDTGVDRVLISDDFVYFGGEGPVIPATLRDANERPLLKKGRGDSRFDDNHLAAELEVWVKSLGVSGYQGRPQEWIDLRDN